MTHWRETSRESLDGKQIPGSRAPYSTRRNFLPAIDPEFPRGNAAQLVLDVFLIVFGIAFAFIYAVGLGAGIYWLLTSIVR